MRRKTFPRDFSGPLISITKAEAISEYSHLFRRSEGLYLTLKDQGSMEQDFLEQTKDRDIDLIVCSDAEAILGIGDQGVGVRFAHESPYLPC